VTQIERMPKALMFSNGLWIAAVAAVLPGVDAMQCLLAQLLIIAAWGGSDEDY
jgi:hypothetical protein